MNFSGTIDETNGMTMTRLIERIVHTDTPGELRLHDPASGRKATVAIRRGMVEEVHFGEMAGDPALTAISQVMPWTFEFVGDEAGAVPAHPSMVSRKPRARAVVRTAPRPVPAPVTAEPAADPAPATPAEAQTPPPESGTEVLSEPAKSPSEPTVDASEQAVDASEQAVDASEQAVDASQRVVDSSERVVDSSERVVDSSERVVDSSERVVDSSERVVDPSERVVDPSERVVDPSERVVDASERVVDASDSPKQEAIFTEPLAETPEPAISTDPDAAFREWVIAPAAEYSIRFGSIGGVFSGDIHEDDHGYFESDFDFLRTTAAAIARSLGAPLPEVLAIAEPERATGYMAIDGGFLGIMGGAGTGVRHVLDFPAPTEP